MIFGVWVYGHEGHFALKFRDAGLVYIRAVIEVVTPELYMPLNRMFFSATNALVAPSRMPLAIFMLSEMLVAKSLIC